MRILVTGGAGFIGSHLVDRFLADGHAVWALDDLSSGRLSNLPAAAEFIEADITRAARLDELVRAVRPEAVVHCAAQVSAPGSLAAPDADAATNVIGLLRLLEALRELPAAPRFIFASSGGAIYGDATVLPCTESTPPSPATPYGVSKLAAEHYLAIYRKQYGLPFVVLRYANVFGPRQNLSRETGVCAVFAGAATSGAPLTVFGDGSQTRDYVYVADVVEANALALTLGEGETLNVGTGLETSTGRLAEVIVALSGNRSPIRHLPPRAGDVQRASVASERAAQVLGWRPAWSLADGLRQTLAWYEALDAEPVSSAS